MTSRCPSCYHYRKVVGIIATDKPMCCREFDIYIGVPVPSVCEVEGDIGGEVSNDAMPEK